MAGYSIAAGETGAAVRTKLNAVVGQVDSTTAAHTVTSTSAAALAVGANGATNPALQVDASANTVKTGIKVTGAAEAGGATIAVISSGDNENLTIAPKGTGSVVISKADINGGAIDGTTIGANAAGAGTFTTLGATTATVTTANATTFDTNVAAAGVTLTGTTLAADGTDAHIDISITPKGTGEVNLTKVDIDAGTIDGTTIGGSSAAAGTFTTANATTFDTNAAAAGVTLTGTTLAADGTDDNINITITPKGTGAVIISKAQIILPTADPHVAGALWNNTGTITISAG